MSGREICPPSLVTVCSVVRPANRHAFWYRKSWQSPGARLGPARCSCPNIGVGGKLTPATALLRVVRVENRPALRVRVGNTRSAHLVCLCFESFCGKLGAHLGSFGKFPEAGQKRPCSESSARKVPACFESVHHLPEVFKWPSWLRVELEKTRYLLRVMLLVSHYLPGDMVAPSQT